MSRRFDNSAGPCYLDLWHFCHKTLCRDVGYMSEWEYCHRIKSFYDLPFWD